MSNGMECWEGSWNGMLVSVIVWNVGICHGIRSLVGLSNGLPRNDKEGISGVHRLFEGQVRK